VKDKDSAIRDEEVAIGHPAVSRADRGSGSKRHARFSAISKELIDNGVLL